MPRPDAPDQEPATLRVTYTGLFFTAIGLIVWYHCLKILYVVLTYDRECLGGASYRRGRFIEDVVCGVMAGPSGWIYLGWLFLPAFALFVWMRRARPAPPQDGNDKG